MLGYCQQVQVWYADPEAMSAADLQQCEGLLSPEERERMARFRFAHSQSEFLVAHSMLRLALSSYTGFHPATWMFTTNDHGRPELVDAQRVKPLRFSLSHSRNLVACAITETVDIGIDVENTTRREISQGLESSILSSLEQPRCKALPAGQRARTLFAYWSLKESYVKARGIGLSMGLAEMSFDLERHPITASFSSALADNPDEWRFFLSAPSPSHVLAVSVRSGCDRDAEVLMHHGLPA